MNQKGFKYLLLICGLSVLGSANIIAQTSNPFDIIITKNNVAPIPILTSPKDSALANQISNDSNQVEYINETETDTIVTEDQSNQNQNIDSLSESNSIVANNPFNIRSGSEARKPETVDIKPARNPELVVSPENRIFKTTSKWIPSFKPRQGDNTARDYSLNFIFWILIASLLIVAIVINLKRKSFLNLYRAITNDNYLKLLQREEHNGGSSFFLLLYFLFFLNAALYLYQLLINKFDDQGYRFFLVLIGLLVSMYLIRFTATFLMQLIFPLKKELKQFNFTIIMFNIIVGLILIPVNILIAYAPFGPTIIYSGLIILALFYLLRQLRGLFIAARVKGMSYFHFFIYLCTFEVAPLIWLISFVKN